MDGAVERPGCCISPSISLNLPTAPRGFGAGSTKGEAMRSGVMLVRLRAIAATFAILSLLPLAGCEIPPSGVPTAASIRGLRPSGTVTMTQAFLVGTGAGSGTLAFRGRSYPFTLIGSLIGPGAISTMQASGEVYKLRDVSQFSGEGVAPVLDQYPWLSRVHLFRPRHRQACVADVAQTA
jgi:hypothetical protein